MGFSQIALFFVVAAVFALVAKALKQPLLIGYLLAGVFLAAFGLVGDISAYQTLGKIGVALLLFLVGVEMNIRDLPEIGKVATYTGLGQILFTSLLTFGLSLLLGFAFLPAVYIAVALSFSSTIIIVKLLSEKNDLASLYGKISIGFLLIQDLVAVTILVFLGSLAGDKLTGLDYLWISIKAIALFAATWLLSKRVLPRLFEKYLLSSNELIIIISVAWALGIAAFVAGPVGFSLEIGGFLAGLALSNLPEHLQIAARTRPLRDFFLTIFFLLLGFDLVAGGLTISVVPAIIFSLVVLVGNPLIVLAILGFLGYKRRTSFLAGLTVAQISEFSLILVAMGASLGHLGKEVVGTVVVVAVVTMITSTYMIMRAEKIYKRLRRLLKLFEKTVTIEQVFVEQSELTDHVVVVGFGKSGRTIAKYFLRRNTPTLIVDFDPKVFKLLSAQKIPVLFGDVTDDEVLAAANVRKAQIVVSTINVLSDNLSLLEYLRTKRSKAQVLMIAQTRQEAIKLYEAGASYVVLPSAVAGEHIRHILRVYGVKSVKIDKMGKGHFNRLLALT